MGKSSGDANIQITSCFDPQKQKLGDEERQAKGHSLTRREKDLIVEFLDERQAELEY